MRDYLLRLYGVSILLSIVLLIGGCGKKTKEDHPSREDYVVIAIEGDVDNFNPLFAQDVTAGEVNDLLYPGLMKSTFDTVHGVLEYHPLVAAAWEFENQSKDVRFHLRTDVRWSDSIPLTARDVQLSYDLYADPAVASVRQSSVERLKKTKEGKLDITKAVEFINDSTVIFHYVNSYPGQLFDAGLPILPYHILSDVPRKSMREHAISNNPLSSGPFVLKSWKPQSEIVLASNVQSFIPAKLSHLVLRVIPDYASRLKQLGSREIDIFPYINVEDAIQITKSDTAIGIIPMGERFYDAVNWNNVDPGAYTSSKGKSIRPHPLFGSPKVRRALTLAINRKEIVETYLKPYGREAIGPISPLFKWAYNDSINPLPYEPSTALALLAEEGWRDTNGDGILDKNGRPFSFTLKIAGGNQLRANIAAIIQNQLKAIHIEVKIEQLERSAFWDIVMAKNFDACIAGFSVPLQMQLDELWGGDFDKSPFNIPSFRNRRVDEILRGAKTIKKETDYAAAWKEFQEILYHEQPCTFLYWMNDLAAVNKRVRGTQIGVLGILYHAGGWYVEHGSANSDVHSP